MGILNVFRKLVPSEPEVRITADSIVINRGHRCTYKKLASSCDVSYAFDQEKEVWRLALTQGGANQEHLFVREFADAKHGQPLFDSIKRQLNDRGGVVGGRRWLPWAGGAALGFASVVLIGLMMTQTAPQADAAVIARGSMSQAPGAQPDVSQSALPPPVMLMPDELARVAGASMFVRGLEGGKLAYVFSDPLCPSCKDLDRQAEVAQASIRLAVVPVAFKDGSEELAAGALCSKDPAKAWAQIMSSGYSDEKVCDAGLKKVRANNELFKSLGFGQTPTLVSPKGTLAAGAAPAADLVHWVQNF